MGKPFAAFDIDGTIFRSSLLIEVTRECVRKGLFPAEAVAEVDQALQRWQARESAASYDEYLMTVVDTFMRHIKGVTQKQFAIISQAVIDRTYKHTYVYTRELIKQLQPTHALVAISGSPSTLVKEFVNHYGFDAFVASEYEVVDGVYTGGAEKAHSHKDKIIARLVEERGYERRGSVAVGDSSGDIELLASAEQPIAFNPDARLREAAFERGWKVVVERKSQIYELEPERGRYLLAQTD